QMSGMRLLAKARWSSQSPMYGWYRMWRPSTIRPESTSKVSLGVWGLQEQLLTSDRCRACGGKLTLTGTKMNPQTGHHKWDRGRALDHRRAAGEDVPVYDR